jgi:RNA polymerase sigma-70 factor (ECF subfamily)
VAPSTSTPSTASAAASDAAASDAVLLDRARDGDRWAFQQVVQRYEDQVAATVVGMLGPGPDADDVGQETFIRFYKALDQFRGESGLGTYLTRIAINQSLKALRKKKRWYNRFLSRDNEERTLEEPALDGADVVGRRERAALVHEALATLSEDHRAVVVLRLLDGYSTRETADILDIPEGTVMSRLYRATSNLKDELRPWLEA